MSFRTFGTLTGYLDESIGILQTMRQKSGYHREMEKSRISTHGSDLSQEEIISHEDYSTNSKVRNESINFSLTKQSEELNEEGGPHTPQSKDQVDEDVDDLVENFQAHSPPASQISFRTFGTLAGYLDETIGILETSKQPRKGPESVNMMKNLNGQSSEYRNTHNCRLCSKSFPNNRILIAHFKWVHNQCEYCEKIFKCQSDLSTHLKIHDGERLFHCDQCNKSFAKTHLLDIHVKRSHNKDRPYRWDVPVTKAHGKERPYQCTRCNKAYKSEGFLARHLAGCKEFPAMLTNSDTHEIGKVSSELRTATQSDITSNIDSSEETLYQCDECYKSFKKKSSLLKHVNVHDKESRYTAITSNIDGNEVILYQCDQCEKTFKRKYSLRKHVELHDKESRYKSIYCSKTFKTKMSLIPNNSTVRGDERSYQCNHCDKVFDKKENLTQHQITHSLSERKSRNPRQMGNLVDSSEATRGLSRNLNYLKNQNKLDTGVITDKGSVIGGQNRVIREDENHSSAKCNDSSLMILNLDTHEVTPSKNSIETDDDINPNKDINEEQNDIPQSKESAKAQNDTQNKDLMDGDTDTPHNKDLTDDVSKFLDDVPIPSPQSSEVSYRNLMSVNTLVGLLDENT